MSETLRLGSFKNWSDEEIWDYVKQFDDYRHYAFAKEENGAKLIIASLTMRGVYFLFECSNQYYHQVGNHYHPERVYKSTLIAKKYRPHEIMDMEAFRDYIEATFNKDYRERDRRNTLRNFITKLEQFSADDPHISAVDLVHKLRKQL